IFLDAERRLRHYVEGDFPSFFLWLRLVAGQTLSKVHRTHLGTESRNALRETSAGGKNVWGNTSLCLSQRFIAHMTSPSQAAVREELIVEVRRALEGMNEIDREVLALRHFEELTNQEVAIELDIKPKAASIRYMRALERLRGVLNAMSE
ncbi:MAG: sigma-70 family RNA polymerase sigma factor, partial [Planctomycetota bacterium]